MITSPYLPGWEYIPDGEPHIFGDRLYIFGSHDRFNGPAFCANDYVGWSAPLSDLSEWRYEGVTFKAVQDPGNADGKFQLWAPDVSQGPDGRYYLYYCLSNQPWIGVAVSDSPAGKYDFYGYVQDKEGGIVGQRENDMWPFDPAVLFDDDGRIHLYAGQGPLNAKMAKQRAKTHKYTYHMELERDMKTLKTEPQPLIPNVTNSAGTGFETHEFFEASSIRKFEGRYYFIYSSVRMHELCWAVSDRPEGGFAYGGTLISNGDIGLDGEDVNIGVNGKANLQIKNYIGNNHGSVVKIGDAYYVFYHRQTNRHMFSRQGCVAKVPFENGRFSQAEMTSCGLSDALPGRGLFEARIACELYSKKGALFSAHPLIQNKNHPAFTQDTGDVSGEDAQEGRIAYQYIQNMTDGAVAVYKYFALSDAKSLTVTVRGKAQGLITVYANEKLSAVLPIGKDEAWHKVTGTFDAPQIPEQPENPEQAQAARMSLRFTYEGKGAVDMLSFELA
ncbi:MAG: family 43 glycosylhydrolase [Firmicutes bacterium]|nr:family 43 glycosylhydrolase [Bacillota bacterium]